MNQGTRKKWIYERYCDNRELINEDEFIDIVKSTYYKYDAPLYSPNYESLLVSQFSNFFSSATGGADIVDIGAGTGQALKIIKNLGYQYNKYYYIEPFKSMSDQCNCLDHTVVVVNKYIDNLRLETDVKIPRIFVICAVLRTISNMPEFLLSLKSLMKPGDKCFFPIEPNNDYFVNSRLFLCYKIKYKLIVFAKKIFKIYSNKSENKNNLKEMSEDYLDFVLDELHNNNIVNNMFTKERIMSIVYYNNYLYWRAEIKNIPGDYNEGFFNFRSIADELECKIEITSRNYFYGLNFFGMSTLAYCVDRILDHIMPGNGATMCAIMTKE